MLCMLIYNVFRSEQLRSTTGHILDTKLQVYLTFFIICEGMQLELYCELWSISLCTKLYF